MSTRNTVMLIDCENTSNKLINSLLGIKDTDKLLILGEKQLPSQYDLENHADVRYEKCKFAGKNAADVALIFELGKLIGKSKYKNVTILSGDKDFDLWIKYIRNTGVNIERLYFTQGKFNCRSVLNILSSYKSGVALSRLIDELELKFTDKSTILNAFNKV